jgi:hypothetical protein
MQLQKDALQPSIRIFGMGATDTSPALKQVVSNKTTNVIKPLVFLLTLNDFIKISFTSLLC